MLIAFKNQKFLSISHKIESEVFFLNILKHAFYDPICHKPLPLTSILSRYCDARIEQNCFDLHSAYYIPDVLLATKKS